MRFLAEFYEPDSRPSAADLIAARARAAAEDLVRAGAEMRFIRATLVPAEETCFLLYEAPSAEFVQHAVQRASIRDARVTEVRESR